MNEIMKKFINESFNKDFIKIKNLGNFCEVEDKTGDKIIILSNPFDEKELSVLFSDGTKRKYKLKYDKYFKKHIWLVYDK